MSVWQEVQEPDEKPLETAEQNNEVTFEVEEEVVAPEPKTKKLAKQPKPEADDGIEIVDDTPPQDRGRGAAAPPPDVTDEELEGYSDKVKKRLSHLMRGYHDERRTKEQALRERQAAEEFAQAQLRKTKELEARLAELQATANTATKSQLETQLEQARKAYKDAYDAGDADALVAAQDQVFEVRMKLAEADKAPVAAPPVKEATLQEEENAVYSKPYAAEQAVTAPDTKAIAWHVDNPWYGQDKLMTQFAQGLHFDLVVNKQIDPTTETYYETLNKRVRQAFPDYDWADNDLNADAPEPVESRRAEKKPATVVAGASRSTPARKVKLTQSQVAIARRLGVSLEEYARQVADLNNGGR